MNGKNQKGFTLVEIIVSLILVGILTSIAGMGIVKATRTYLFSRDASAITQKTQAAYARMSRTFLNITDVAFPGGINDRTAPLQVTIERNNVEITETYQFTGSVLSLEINGGNTNNILDDLAATSNFSYLKNDGTPWQTSDNESDLSRIIVTIDMNSPGGQSVAFSGSFVPRNVYRPEGILTFSAGQAGIPNTGSCFVSSLVNNKTDSQSIVYLLTGGFLILLLIPVARRIKMRKMNQKGSILIGVIITMIVMGILAAAMTSMFSSSSVGTVTPNMSDSAYYTAESAYRYALFTFLGAQANTKFQTLSNDLNGQTIIIAGDKRADFEIDTFFFSVNGNQADTRNLNVTAPVSFPEEYVNSTGTVVLPTTGYLAIEEDNNAPVQYTNVSYNSGDETLTFELSTQKTVNDGTAVFPAFLNLSMDSIITEGSNLSVGTGNLAGFPQKNGVFSLHTTDGGTYILLYEYLDTDSTPPQLVNIKNAANLSAIPSSGLQNYGTIKYISLLQNARISVTGYAGDRTTNFHAERQIDYYQPMIEGTIIIKHEVTETFDNLDNWRTGGGSEIGRHEIVQVNDSGAEETDGDNAMRITETDEVTSLITADYHNTGVQESLLEYDPNVAGFEDIWARSDEKLSYEIQCKIAFSDANDNADNNPKGTYMPGIVFRVKDTQVGSATTKEYYGLSFMRALFDKDNMAASGDDDDADDIPDKYLFTNNDTNKAISDDIADNVCIEDYTAPPLWNDQPPISGVPYMLLWQQAFHFASGGDWTNYDYDNLYLDWMAYVPLCKLTEVTIYHYPEQAVGGSDSVPCDLCATCTPKTWRKDYREPPIGYGWSPDCCIARTETDRGGSGRMRNRWREYRCDKYDCAGECYDATCCGVPVTYPEGWYLGRIPGGDPRTPDVYTAYRIENHNEYGEILQHVTKNVNGTDIDIIGDMNNLTYLVRNPATFDSTTGYRGNPIEYSAFVFPNESVTFQNDHNYRVYLKPWVTVMARIVEMKGDFIDETGGTNGCGNSTEERINVIQAWFGEPDTYPRGTFTWPDISSSSFSEMIWPDRGYTSKMDSIDYWIYTENRRLVERGEDQYQSTETKRSPLVYSNQLTTEDYDTYPSGNQPAEVGIHTFGIDASNSDDQYNDLVYFDDFSIRIFEYGRATGLLPGVQNE